MELVLTIADELVPDLRNGDAKPLDRRALELLAVDGYKKGELTAYQVQKMLGFDDRFEVDALLKEPGVYYDYTTEELLSDEVALDTLLKAHGRRSLSLIQQLSAVKGVGCYT
jgi:hypothetical protein